MYPFSSFVYLKIKRFYEKQIIKIISPMHVEMRKTVCFRNDIRRMTKGSVCLTNCCISKTHRPQNHSSGED